MDEVVKNASKISYEVLPTPIKGELDKKEYRVIKLSNGLVACLISDKCSTIIPIEDVLFVDAEDEDEVSEEEMDDEEEESIEEGEEMGNDNVQPKEANAPKMAAAALCISTGSFSDPRETPGLAHFLEHMVFMGSEKYPKENDFDSYITKKGGSNNASTDGEHTNFYFECLEKYLYLSLDKFAHFFISPLLMRDSMTREKQAVDSEFQMALPSDGIRKQQFLMSFCNPEVPINTFSWGNLNTLQENIDDDNLYDILRAFKNKHYSANRMTLCIQARLPLDILQAFVLDCFNSVPNNNSTKPDFRQYSTKIFRKSDFNKMHYITPVQDVKQMDIMWILPSTLHLYKSKPHEYLSWLLKHEGKGSLMSYLRKKVWAVGIDIGNFDGDYESNAMYTAFDLEITLTEAGLSNVNSVIEAIYAYINMLKNVGPQERIFKEIQQIQEMGFRFADEVSPVEMVENVADNMHFFPSEDFFTGPELLFEYNPQAIEMCLNSLRPDNMNVMIFSKNLPDGIICDKIEPWFKTTYSAKDFPEELIKTWSHVTQYTEFFIPEPNKFLTSNFNLLQKNDDNKFPVKLIDNNLVELWYKVDNKFKLPIVNYNFHFITPLLEKSAENACMMELYILLLQIIMMEEIYPATVASLELTVGHKESGIALKISGYNEKIPILVEVIGKYIRNFSDMLKPELYEAMKEIQRQVYYNQLIKPSNLGKDARLSLLIASYWTSLEKYSALKNVTCETMINFGKEFIKNLRVQALIQGNMDSTVAVDTTNKLLNTIGCSALDSNNIPSIRVYEVPKGEACCRIASFNEKDSNSDVTNYYQSGPISIKTCVIVELLMLMFSEPFFNQIRTIDQLGYAAYCMLRDTFGILGYSFSVVTQVDKFSTDFVDQRIESFLENQYASLVKMSDKELESYKNDLIKVKKCEDIKLEDEVKRHWAEIMKRDYIFDRQQREIKAIEDIKLHDLIAFVGNSTMSSPDNKCQKLSVQIVGHKNESVEGGDFTDKPGGTSTKEFNLNYLDPMSHDITKEKTSIMDVELFKKDMQLYPPKKSQS